MWNSIQVRWVIVNHYKTEPHEVVYGEKFINEDDAERKMRQLVRDLDVDDKGFRYATVERRVYANLVD